MSAPGEVDRARMPSPRRPQGGQVGRPLSRAGLALRMPWWWFLGAGATLSTCVPHGGTPYVSVGPTLDCGITVDGHVMCWGSNDGGRLGIGSTQGGPQRAALVQGLPQATLSPP